MGEILDYLQKNWVIVTMIAGTVMGYFWLTMDSRYVKKADFEKLQTAIKENDRRVTVLEENIKDTPTDGDMARIELLISEIKGALNGTTATVEAMSNQVHMLVEAKVLGKRKGLSDD